MATPTVWRTTRFLFRMLHVFVDTPALRRRFWSRVTIGDGCWNHSGSLSSSGYPQFRNTLAHRASWEFANGPISKGVFICHKCNNKKCVRPDHLYAGTHKQNMDDVAKTMSHPKRKLTSCEVAEIRSSSESQRTLARRYGVSQRSIWDVIRRNTYVHDDGLGR